MYGDLPAAGGLADPHPTRRAHFSFAPWCRGVGFCESADPAADLDALSCLEVPNNLEPALAALERVSLPFNWLASLGLGPG